jgi:hypothetical protein
MLLLAVSQGAFPHTTTVLISLCYYLISVFMGKKDIMDLVYKNEIHSIFGASPIACRYTGNY